LTGLDALIELGQLGARRVIVGADDGKLAERALFAGKLTVQQIYSIQKWINHKRKQQRSHNHDSKSNHD
jgi:tRNA U34 5-carboxymethylaminomethyl modifying GTPase MnmE/TrmE